ncbi:tyrosinase-like protein 1 [Pecten maximus]|uniref:tyrosinase-like protein 1 n=1 Tax=Pecten maximus TaxID=6579 RepID=UPI001458E079|nr:tyrosinase-like protein 1 [Pecten maximus]
MPYWDSSLDFHIMNPENSILWTRFLFGNGRGTVRTGPFSTFTEPNGDRISRNIGRAGTLIARENIESILNRTSNRELVYTNLLTLEGYHNGPHVWGGGTLQGITTAPADPIFWFHHSFVDKLWSDVQRRMPNPENYPYEPITNRAQRPREPMAMFPVDPNFPLLNQDGYMRWVSRQSTYRRSPGQARRRLRCENRAWRVRQVLVWDDQRLICVTGEGRPDDFNAPPDTQTNRLSASAFNDGSASGLKFVSPLRDTRTFAMPSNVNFLNAESRGSAIRNGVFNNMFVSEIRDMRTMPSARFPPRDRQAGGLLLGEVIAQLERRQNNLMAQSSNNIQSPLSVTRSNGNFINGFGSGLQVPFENNIFPGQSFGQTGQLVGQTGGPIGQSIGHMGGLVGHPLGQTRQQTLGHLPGFNSATSTRNNIVQTLLARARQRNSQAPTIGNLNLIPL